MHNESVYLINTALHDYKSNKQLRKKKKTASVSGEGIFITVKIKPTWLLQATGNKQTNIT